jgi:hypothetical protein
MFRGMREVVAERCGSEDPRYNSKDRARLGFELLLVVGHTLELGNFVGGRIHARIEGYVDAD